MNDSLHTQTERAADIRRDRDELRHLLNAERRAAQIVGAEHKKDVRERDELRAENEWLRTQNDELHRQIEYTRSLTWDDIPDKDVVANLRRMLDRPKGVW